MFLEKNLGLEATPNALLATTATTIGNSRRRCDLTRITSPSAARQHGLAEPVQWGFRL